MAKKKASSATTRLQDSDPGWSEFLIDNLADHELYEGSPKVDGLRRVTQKFLGHIVESQSELIQSPNTENHYTCIVKHTLVIDRHDSKGTVKVNGIVDVKRDSMPPALKEKVVATADTNAESKALRRALKIAYVTSEELQSADDAEDLSNQEMANDQQMMAINTLCKRMDVSVVSAIGDKDPKDLTNLEARVVLGNLSRYQRNTDDVPEEWNTYEENWRTKK